MSDAPVTPAAVTPAAAPADESPEVLGEAGLSALRAERAANKDYKAKLKAAEDALAARDAADMSELQKAQKKATDWEAKAKGYERAQAISEIKARISAEAGVPADLLAGDDEASITAFAERLKAHLGPQKPDPNPFLGKPGGQSPVDTDAAALQALGFGN